MTTLKQMQKRVEKGCKYLDKNFPDWYKEVVPTKLDLRNGQVCILGQMFDGYAKEPWETGYDLFEREHPEFDLVAHGFVLSDEESDLDYEGVYLFAPVAKGMGLNVAVEPWSVLDVLWLDAIQGRRDVDRDVALTAAGVK